MDILMFWNKHLYTYFLVLFPILYIFFKQKFSAQVNELEPRLKAINPLISLCMLIKSNIVLMLVINDSCQWKKFVKKSINKCHFH